VPLKGQHVTTFDTGRALLAKLRPIDGCRWCGVQKEPHMQRWTELAGWHTWTELTQPEIKGRMLARRAARLCMEPFKYHATTAWAADATGESGEPYCADCKTNGCRQWIRIQDRLERRRMELAGINPKARRPSDGSGGWGGEPPW
jgi:hypothetical protein